MFDNFLKVIKANDPVIQSITNYVTVNDCANALIAIGASPIMSDSSQEAEDISKICSALSINIGTLNADVVKTMLDAGKNSNKLNHPVLLDPVAVGASKLRKETVENLLRNINFDVIRGNASEIISIAQTASTSHGVDVAKEDMITEDSIPRMVKISQDLSKKTGSIIVMTGAIDIIAQNEKVVLVRNGTDYLSKITGTGDILSSLITAGISVNKNRMFESVVESVCLLGYAGEKAEEIVHLKKLGTLSFRTILIDKLSTITDQELEDRKSVV